LVIFSKNVTKIQVSLNLIGATGISDEDLCTLMMESGSSLLRIRNVFKQSCTDNQDTYSVLISFSENHDIHETLWKNNVEPDRPQMTIWCMYIACWITKATDTHSEYVTLTAFPQQQQLHEHASMLRYARIACLANKINVAANMNPAFHVYPVGWVITSYLY